MNNRGECQQMRDPQKSSHGVGSHGNSYRTPHLADPKRCTGCTACFTSCRYSAIQMLPDSLGCLRPVVDETLCLGCGLCERVCPSLSTFASSLPLQCVAAKTKDRELLLKSSSGGLFTELANSVLSSGGVVYGCVLDSGLRAVHVRAVAQEDLEPMRGSKYVQSDLKRTFSDALADLDAGRHVLFVGTPCQIQGLTALIRGQDDNLITVALICHGAPTPAMFEHYKKSEELSAGDKLINFGFRNKSISWREFAISLGFENPAKNKIISQWSGSYMCLFNRNYLMRESCFHCPARRGRSGCDLMIGDYWGVEHAHPHIDSEKGVSCVLAYTEKGVRILKSLSVDCWETTYRQIKKANKNIEGNPCRPFGIEYFRSNYSLKSFDEWTKWVFWGPWWFRPFCPVLHWAEFKATWVKDMYHKVRRAIFLE